MEFETAMLAEFVCVLTLLGFITYELIRIADALEKRNGK